MNLILDSAYQCEQDDVGTFAAEESLRICPKELTEEPPNDEETNSEYLAVFYVKILGKLHRHVYASPIRKVEHLKALYDASHHHSKRIWSFVEIVLSYLTSPSLFKVKIQQVKSSNPFVIDCMMMKKEGSKLLMSMIHEWPQNF